ncbi:hypothetical protein HG263_05380 [Pseudoalteromonas sp. JBTF-M23]|uniref:Phage protein D n=1 Tax=Pseudoalteromonas caenipelagi TaxID=2726988 RepID=A0A849VE12_9GAMM|nr:contractile injection system protein, VgrG/Pvc8 family [Pseudoalteromonas caenipelagi]NOU49967.1 hypothetical protein [Pseudoalteromonas caenipelagi]
MATLKQPKLALTWAGQDVSEDLSAFVEEFTFTDSIEGGRDEITLRLNNKDGRFNNEWFPDYGDLIEPVIISDSGRWALGKYAIDKVAPRFNPSVFVVSALAQEINRDALEKVQSRAFANTSLHAVVGTLAGETGLNPNVDGQDQNLKRLDMRQESAHQLLQRLSKQYGYYYAIKGDLLLFLSKPPVTDVAIDIKQDPRLKAASFEINPRKAYAKATIQFYDTQQKKLITHTETADGIPGDKTLKLYDIANDISDAQHKCLTQLKAQNKAAGGTGTVTLTGSTIDAGSTIKLNNAGKLPENWLAEKVTTTLNSTTGWTTRINLKVKE